MGNRTEILGCRVVAVVSQEDYTVRKQGDSYLSHTKATAKGAYGDS